MVRKAKQLLNFNAYVGVNGWSRTPEMRSGESYIQTLRDASVGAGDGRWSSVADDKNLFTTDAEWSAHQNDVIYRLGGCFVENQCNTELFCFCGWWNGKDKGIFFSELL